MAGRMTCSLYTPSPAIAVFRLPLLFSSSSSFPNCRRPTDGDSEKVLGTPPWCIWVLGRVGVGSLNGKNVLSSFLFFFLFSLSFFFSLR